MIRKHIDWLVLRGCVAARDDGGVFIVRYHQEYVRVSSMNNRVFVTRGTDESVPVRELSDGTNGLAERVSGVFLHPKHSSILIVLDRSGDGVYAQEGLFIELDDLSSVSLVRTKRRGDPHPSSAPVSDKKNVDQVPKGKANSPVLTAAETVAAHPTLASKMATAKAPVVAVDAKNQRAVSEPEAMEVGSPSDEHGTAGVWFADRDLLAANSPCIGFSLDARSGFIMLRQFDQEGVEWRTLQRLSLDIAVPQHTLFSAPNASLSTQAQALQALTKRLSLKHLASCIEGTRRSDTLWFVAYRGRPVLIEASETDLIVTAQSGQARTIAPLVLGERITHVFQHPDEPIAMVMLGIGDNSPLPQRALLVSIGYQR